MRRFIKNPVAWIVTGVMLAAPQATLACSACVGRADNAAAQGLNAAIATLLVVLLVVLGSFAGFIAYLIRRSIKHPLAVPSMPGGVAR
jgi:hypothetical protein